MSTARLLEEFLSRNNVCYELVTHQHTMTSLQSARAAHVAASQLARGVLLEDEENRYIVAVLPADRHILLGQLRGQLGRTVGLATKVEVGWMFADCEAGAVPVLGPLYGVETIWDESLREQPNIYFEAGDHEHLVHMKTPEFVALLGDSRHGRFSTPIHRSTEKDLSS